MSPYASGLACLVEDEMDLGATVVDMGGGTTTIAIFFDGNVVFTDCIPLGGKHITNDIARGLSTSIINAERIKTLHGNAFLSPFEDRKPLKFRKSAKKIVLRPTLLRSQKSFKLFNLGSRNFGAR